ncbi:MAG: hypothetical protein HUU55_03005 [Myxococcales bacterium]|nr:hypothetical protein [Myxococcales bacterium]
MTGRRSTLMLLMILGVVVCGGACGENEDLDGAADGQGTDGNDGAKEEEVTSINDVIVGFPIGDSRNAATLIYRDTCRNYCGTRAACGMMEPDCETNCDAQNTANAPSYGQLRCALASSCDAATTCFSESITEFAECTALCGDLKSCGVFPNDFWGLDETMCKGACGGLLTADAETYGKLIQCYQNFVGNGCQFTNAGSCLVPQNHSESCQTACSSLAQCGNIPGTLFLTIGDCLERCQPLPPWEQLVLQTCISSAGCERYELCFPPVSQTPPTCNPFCESLAGACPDNPYLTPQICSGFCAGLKQALPGLQMDQAAQCIDRLGSCPENSVMFQCALPQPEECPAICASVESCFGTGEECNGYCPYLGAMDPLDLKTLQTCLETSSCQAAPLCFE